MQVKVLEDGRDWIPDPGLGKDGDVLYSAEPFLFTPQNTALALLKTYSLCK